MKKLTINRLAIGNLITRKSQYTLIVIGIILAMTFSSGIIFFISSYITSARELSYRSIGTQDLIITNVNDKSRIEELKANNTFSDYGYAYILGKCYTNDNESRGFCVAKYDEGGKKLAYHSVLEGRMPEKSGEIAVEADALLRLRINAVPGDKITFNFNTSDGVNYSEKTIKKTYTLVGILVNKRSNISAYLPSDNFAVPAAIVSEEELIEAGGRERTIAYVKVTVTKGNKAYTDALDEMNNKNSANDGFIITSQDISRAGSSIITTNMLAVILDVVLIFASCVGIINSFNTNLKERKKQIGLYRAVGASRRQIINIFIREAFIISVISAPLSVLISYFSVKGIIYLIGGDMIFRPKMWTALVCAVSGVIVVMIAAIIPLASASRISPMQAIRDIDTVRRIKNKRLHSKKEYRFPLLISSRQIMISKGTSIALSVILTVSVIICSLGMAFIEYSFHKNDINYDYDYKIYQNYARDDGYSNCADKNGDYGISANTINELLSVPYIKSISVSQLIRITALPEKHYNIIDLYKNDSFDAEIPSSAFNPDEISLNNYIDFFLKYNAESTDSNAPDYIMAEQARTKFGYPDYHFNTDLLALDDKYILNQKENLIAGKINIDRINSGDEVILYVPEESALRIDWSTLNADDNAGERTFISSGAVRYDKMSKKRRNEKTSKIIGTVKNDIAVGDIMTISAVFDKYPGEEGVNYLALFSDEAKNYTKQIRIGAIVNMVSDIDSPYPQNCSFITTNSGLASMGFPEQSVSAEIKLVCPCTDEIDEIVTREIESETTGTDKTYSSLYSYKKDLEKGERLLITGYLSLIIILFVIVSSLISSSTGSRIRDEKRQIGTLRAVGASSSDITKSYILQLLRTFGIGIIGGLSAYSLIHFCIVIVNNTVYNSNTDMRFILWPSLLFAVLTFAVCSFNLYRQIKKQMKHSVVENIREL